MAEVGRPTEYSPTILKEARVYLDECQDDEEQILELDSTEKGYQKFKTKQVVNLPSIEGLARYLNVHRDTLYEWEKQYSEFSDILEQVRAEQAERLINKGLSGDYNSTITKLMLSKHGYVDKSETELKGHMTMSQLLNSLEDDGHKTEGQSVENQPSLQDQRQEQETSDIQTESSAGTLQSEQGQPQPDTQE